MTATPVPGLIRRPQDVTPSWLTAALAAAGVLAPGEEVTAVSWRPVGTGQMADTVRLTYRVGAGPVRSVVAKFASADPTSRSTGVQMRAYEIEVGFYNSVAGRVGTRTPVCHLAAHEPDEPWFVLLLEDMTGAVQGDQLAGCSPEVAAAALDELAALHAPAWGRPELAALPFLDRGGAEADAFLATVIESVWPGFVDRYRQRLAPEHLEVCGRVVAGLRGWLAARPEPTTVVHGDFRLDNLLLTPGQPRPAVVDWQTAAWGAAASDVAYFLGGSLTEDARRRHEADLLAGYHRALVAGGIGGYPLDALEEDVRRLCPGGIVMSVGASMLVQRTPRGDDMFMATAARYAQQALDLGADALLDVPAGG